MERYTDYALFERRRTSADGLNRPFPSIFVDGVSHPDFKIFYCISELSVDAKEIHSVRTWFLKSLPRYSAPT